MGQQKFNGVSVELCDSKEKKNFLWGSRNFGSTKQIVNIKKATFT